MTSFNLVFPSADLCDRPVSASFNASTLHPGRLAHGPDEKHGFFGLMVGFSIVIYLSYLFRHFLA
jgi:hypothetical protein